MAPPKLAGYAPASARCALHLGARYAPRRPRRQLVGVAHKPAQKFDDVSVKCRVDLGHRDLGALAQFWLRARGDCRIAMLGGHAENSATVACHLTTRRAMVVASHLGLAADPSESTPRLVAVHHLRCRLNSIRHVMTTITSEAMRDRGRVRHAPTYRRRHGTREEVTAGVHRGRRLSPQAPSPEEERR